MLYDAKKILVCSLIALFMFIGCSSVQGDRQPHLPRNLSIPDQPAIVGLQFTKGVPVITAIVNNRGTYRFVLDTGSQAVLLSRELADDLNLKSTGEVFMQLTPGGEQMQSSDVVHVKSLDIGGAVFNDFSAVVEDFNIYRQMGYLQIDGVIGIGCFSKCLLTVDLPLRRVVIEKGRLNARKTIAPRAKHDRRQGKERNQSDKIYRWANDSNVPTLPVIVNGKNVGSREFAMKVDTGYNQSFSFPQLIMDGSFDLIKEVETESVTMAGRRLSKYYRLNAKVSVAKVGYIELPLVEISSDYGRLGTGVLQFLSFTVDRDHRLIKLNYNRNTNLLIASTNGS